MLTKELLNFKRSGGRLNPVFVKTDDHELLAFAGQLLAVCRVPENASPLRRYELDEELAPLLQGYKNRKLAEGLAKIMNDRCEFNTPEDYNYAEERRAIFSRAAQILRGRGQNLHYADFKAEIISSGPRAADFIANGIYADLPDNERLTVVKALFPRELLERYNVSQVQSLLLFSERLKLRIHEPDPAELRKFFKYLKFFRLLSELKQCPDGALEAVIDGPASLFENTRKYGLQLASFFPAVCALREWRLQADINWDGSVFRLELDQNAGLVCHYRNFSAYVPEEIDMFHRYFKTKVDDWKIIEGTPFFKAENSSDLIFPDLNFEHGSGRKIHLELFHRWHSGQLLRRLEFCAAHPELPLLLGVDRKLEKQLEIGDALRESRFFQEKGFLFNDFPGVDRVHALLEKVRSK